MSEDDIPPSCAEQRRQHLLATLRSDDRAWSTKALTDTCPIEHYQVYVGQRLENRSGAPGYGMVYASLRQLENSGLIERRHGPDPAGHGAGGRSLWWRAIITNRERAAWEQMMVRWDETASDPTPRQQP